MVPAIMSAQMKSIQKCNADEARPKLHASQADLKQDILIEAGQGRAGQGSSSLDSMPKQSSCNPLERVGHPQNVNLPL